MALRTLVDDGCEWTVWDVVRSLEGFSSLPLPAEAARTWLCFQSAGEKRRLWPVPPGWEQWPDERLRLALRAAKSVGAVPARPPPAPVPEPGDDGQERRDRIAATLDRARALGDRVRAAMAEGHAASLLPPVEPDPLPEP